MEGPHLFHSLFCMLHGKIKVSCKSVFPPFLQRGRKGLVTSLGFMRHNSTDVTLTKITIPSAPSPFFHLYGEKKGKKAMLNLDVLCPIRREERNMDGRLMHRGMRQLAKVFTKSQNGTVNDPGRK